MSKVLTIKALREFIQDMPDDGEVWVATGGSYEAKPLFFLTKGMKQKDGFLDQHMYEEYPDDVNMAEEDWNPKDLLVIPDNLEPDGTCD